MPRALMAIPKASEKLTVRFIKPMPPMAMTASQNGAVVRTAGPKVAVVWGHRREIHPEQSIYNRVLDLDWIYAPGPTLFCGGDALFRRSVLTATNGFDASSSSLKKRPCSSLVFNVEK